MINLITENSQHIEKHPLEPFLPAATKLLMLGSFPPKRVRWSMDFYYPNMQNDMWRIFGIVFFCDKEYFLTADRKHFRQEEIEKLLTEKGIGISDTAKEVIRHKDNASDNFLEVVTPVDLEAMLKQIPECTAIITTGQKATETLIKLTGSAEPKVGGYTEFTFLGRKIKHYRMPSSSRAYPKPVEEKAAVYKIMFSEQGIT